MYRTLAQSIREYKKDSLKTPVYIALEVMMECTIPFITAQLVNQIKAGSDFGVLSRYGLVLVIMALL